MKYLKKKTIVVHQPFVYHEQTVCYISQLLPNCFLNNFLCRFERFLLKITLFPVSKSISKLGLILFTILHTKISRDSQELYSYLQIILGKKCSDKCTSTFKTSLKHLNEVL